MPERVIIDIDNMSNATYYNHNRKRMTNVRDYFFILGQKAVLTSGFIKKVTENSKGRVGFS
jgi:hypothetical protein